MADDHAAVLGELRNFLAGGSLGSERAYSISVDASLRDLGVLNSLGMARLVAFIRDGLGVEIPLRELSSGKFRTLSEITSLVLSARAAQ